MTAVPPALLAHPTPPHPEEPAARASRRTHRHPIRVYYEDTDAAGIVYHANYLKFAERGRTEFLRSLGHSHTSARAESGIAFVVRRCTADFLVPARLDDALAVVTSVIAVRGALLTLRQEIRRDDVLVAAIDIDVACIGREGRAQRLPPLLRAMLLSK
ncbi:MAG TPA: tol-pal system-associated acyl-CoA thioesterase [Stellaceae bacterium]|nr:tol-pal system-associated acyl-CoA thioesterase [Stellaceae bacterium]